MNIKTKPTSELLKAKEEAEKQFSGFREYLNSLNIKEIVSPIVETKSAGETLTQSDILEAIKMIAKTEVK